MLVRHRMTPDPVSIGRDETLAAAFEKMAVGQFRRLPVVEGGRLVGILTERDLARHEGHLRTTRVGAAMTEKPVTVDSSTSLAAAAAQMIREKIGGLPVVDLGRLVGIVTTTDVMRGFLEVIGAEAEGGARIDIDGMAGPDLVGACRVAQECGGEVMSVGVYRDEDSARPVFYLRLKGAEPRAVSTALSRRGFDVLGLHP